MDLKGDQGTLLEELEQFLKSLEQATAFMSGEAYVMASALPSLVNGLWKSTQPTSFESASVYSFQTAAAQEVTSSWEHVIRTFTEDGKSLCDWRCP